MASRFLRLLEARASSRGQTTALSDADQCWRWGRLLEEVGRRRLLLRERLVVGGGAPAFRQLTLKEAALKAADHLETDHSETDRSDTDRSETDHSVTDRSVAGHSATGHVLLVSGTPSVQTAAWILACLFEGQRFVLLPEAAADAEPTLFSWASLMLRDDKLNAFPTEQPADALGLAADQVCLLRTSGTTGRPKYVPFSLSNFEAHADATATHLNLSVDDRWMACLPLHHIGGLSVLLRGLILGNAVHMQPKFGPDETLDLLRNQRTTHVSLVPTMLRRLLDAGGAERLRSMQLLLIGGAAPMPSLLHEARAAGLPLALTYGLTEACSQVTTLTPQGFLAGRSDSGMPLPGAEYEIRDEGGLVLPEGKEGVVHVRAPWIPETYADGKPLLENGWLPTGDWGVAQSGHLRILDRRDDLIVTGGENVRPSEVETVVQTFPGIADCMVVGLPDEEWGAKVVAAYVGEAVDEVELGRHCRALLPGFKAPKAWVRLAELPRTAGGKPRRRVLRENIRTQMTQIYAVRIRANADYAD